MAIWGVLWILVIEINCFGSYAQAPYADWAHDHVVWLNSKSQNQSAIQKMVQDYTQNRIPVGGVNIDSAWSNNFNDFTWNRLKFPDPEGLIKRFHSKGIKVIVWATPIINKECPLYPSALKNNYFLSKGKTVKWWHGEGAFIDFTNPNAKSWWFSLMDQVLNMGIDGFKCDGADPLIALLGIPRTSKGRFIGMHEYGHLYYGNFYNHTKQKNKNGLIMSRPCDGIQGFYWSFSPQYVMFSGWVGDQDSSAEGLRQAVLRVLHSAWKGYLNFGFDIGGYRGQNITKNIFIRWVQLGAMVPFMENGGNGKHQPWSFDQETVDIYRQFVLIHASLKPFFLTAGTQAFSKKVSVIQPLAKKQNWIALKGPQSYGYVLWNDILVFPIFEQYGMANLSFPKGHRWVYYFNHKKVFEGGQKMDFVFPLNQSPIFMREGSVIALRDEIVIVLPNENINKTLIYGEYSYDLEMIINNGQIAIALKQYEKEVKLNEMSRTIKIRIIGQYRQQEDIEYGDLVIQYNLQNERQIINLNQSYQGNTGQQQDQYELS